MKFVNVPSIASPIMPAPGFQKKHLADFKLDLMALCGFGCTYCSSNEGNYLRINRERFADLTEQQLGERLYPSKAPDLTMLWPDVLTKLEAQVRQHEKTARGRGKPPWGTDQTLVFSMLTDGFSPVLVGNGTTEKALRLVLDHTGFRIRVLTKNAVVGREKWIRFFSEHPGRFVVGLSCGTLDRGWAVNVEMGTSNPYARLAALRALQDAGVPTFGMMCPVFPDMLRNDGDPAIEALIDRMRPELCETMWAEPFNDRANWRSVQAGYEPGSPGWDWFQDVYGGEDRARGRMLWSRYATALYERIRRHARAGGWLSKLKYLLYESDITAADAPTFAGLEGVLLQSATTDADLSTNPHIAALQQEMLS